MPLQQQIVDGEVPQPIAMPHPRIWHGIGRQLAHPTGWAGWLTGVLMGVVNRGPNAAMLDALDLSADDHVLDAGCGAGQLMTAMLKSAWRVDGFDGSALMVQQASRRNALAVAEGRCKLAHATFSALPYADNLFTRIAASNVIYFWQDIPRVIAEFQRVLRPGGRIIIYATAAQSMANWRFAQTGTHRLFSPESFEGALREAAGNSMTLDVRQIQLKGGVTGMIATLDSLPPK
jgi:SAM-dependent methyltransferase